MRHLTKLFVAVEIAWIVALCFACGAIMDMRANAEELIVIDSAPDMDAPGGTDYESFLEPMPVYADITMTEQEARELEKIVAMEAQTQGLEGEVAVCEVIFNRVLSDEWPDTVHGVLSQKGQFSTWRYINRPYNQPGELESDAISAALREVTTVLPDTGYVFFCTSRRGWMSDCIRIGAHWFGR